MTTISTKVKRIFNALYRTQLKNICDNQLVRMNVTHIRRATTSTYLSLQYFRYKPIKSLYLFRNPPNLQHSLQICTSQSLLIEKTNPGLSTFAESCCPPKQQLPSLKLPFVDINFDFRQVHHAFQFGLALQRILPSK